MLSKMTGEDRQSIRPYVRRPDIQAGQDDRGLLGAPLLVSEGTSASRACRHGDQKSGTPPVARVHGKLRHLPVRSRPPQLHGLRGH